VALFRKERALDRPLRKASWPHHLDLFPLCILDKCSPDDQAHACVTGIHIKPMLGKNANVWNTMADGKQYGMTNRSNPMCIMKPLVDELLDKICMLLEKRA